MTTWVGSGYSQPGSAALNAQQVTDWLTAFHNACVGCGLVNTADTGQISHTSPPSWPTGQGYMAGYKIYRFNDSQQATDPVFLKFRFGRSGTPAAGGSIELTVGQGSNGAGTLTGTTAIIWGGDGGGDNWATSTYSVADYACHTEGHFVIANRLGWPPGAAGGTFLALSRTRNPSTYAFDAQGVIGYGPTTIQAPWSYRGMLMTAVKWGVGVMVSGSRSYCIVPGTPANTALLNGDKQLYPHFYRWPDIRQHWSVFTARQSEIGTNPTTFSATPLTSGGARTFINFGTNPSANPSANATYDSNFAPCFLWE